MREVIRNMMVGGGLLAAFGVIGVAIVAFTWERTAPQIRDNERHVLTSTLHQIIPPAAHDNDLLEDLVTVQDRDLLGTHDPVSVYRAFKDGKPVAALFTSVAPGGYNGDIRLLVGVWADGRIAGVRVLHHRETPGLGDFVEIERSDWITEFEGRSLEDPPRGEWAVRKDGGVFDQFTGATITPRAVVRAVRNTLIYFEHHRDKIFES